MTSDVKHAVKPSTAKFNFLALCIVILFDTCLMCY